MDRKSISFEVSSPKVRASIYSSLSVRAITFLILLSVCKSSTKWSFLIIFVRDSFCEDAGSFFTTCTLVSAKRKKPLSKPCCSDVGLLIRSLMKKMREMLSVASAYEALKTTVLVVSSKTATTFLSNKNAALLSQMQTSKIMRFSNLLGISSFDYKVHSKSEKLTSSTWLDCFPRTSKLLGIPPSRASTRLKLSVPSSIVIINLTYLARPVSKGSQSNTTKWFCLIKITKNWNPTTEKSKITSSSL